MNVIKIQKLIFDSLKDFITNNELDVLNNNENAFGFELCLGNKKDYLFINYFIHDNALGGYKIFIGFGKRKFVKDNALKFVSMKPHYKLEELAENFDAEVTFKYEIDKLIILKVCTLIPTAFKILSAQSDDDFYLKCINAKS